MKKLFVYGSLKEGFPNHHFNSGRRISGSFRTAQPYPLYLFKGRLPCLLPQPGTGFPVKGQLFDVSVEDLHAMDELERVGQAGGYRRLELSVVADDDGSTVVACAYFQDPSLLEQAGPHVGPLREYTAEHARSLEW